MNILKKIARKILFQELQELNKTVSTLQNTNKQLIKESEFLYSLKYSNDLLIKDNKTNIDKICTLNNTIEQLNNTIDERNNTIDTLNNSLDSLEKQYKSDKDTFYKMKYEIKKTLITPASKLSDDFNFSCYINDETKQYSISLGFCQYGGCDMDTYDLDSKEEVIKAEIILDLLGYKPFEGLCDECRAEYNHL